MAGLKTGIESFLQAISRVPKKQVPIKAQPNNDPFQNQKPNWAQKKVTMVIETIKIPKQNFHQTKVI